MKELKVFLSEFHDEDFRDEVSGITFKKSSSLEVYGISLEDNKASGIQDALRKNILIPYDLKTRDFVNSHNLAKQVVEPAKQVEEVKEEVKEEAAAEVVVEIKAEEKAPVKKPVKRAPKKEKTNQ